MLDNVFRHLIANIGSLKSHNPKELVELVQSSSLDGLSKKDYIEEIKEVELIGEASHPVALSDAA